MRIEYSHGTNIKILEENIALEEPDLSSIVSQIYQDRSFGSKKSQVKDFVPGSTDNSPLEDAEKRFARNYWKVEGTPLGNYLQNQIKPLLDSVKTGMGLVDNTKNGIDNHLISELYGEAVRATRALDRSIGEIGNKAIQSYKNDPENNSRIGSQVRLDVYKGKKNI